MADRLARIGAELVVGNSPSLNQPDLPPNVSRSFIRAAIGQQQQETWLRKMIEHHDRDHLTSIQMGLKPVSRFFKGNRFLQTTLARFRFGHSCLRAHMFRIGRSNSSICVCGRGEEDNDHFLLHCRLYDSQRYPMLHSLEGLLPDTNLSANVLLGGPEFKGTDDTYERVAKVVIIFLKRTQRLD